MSRLSEDSRVRRVRRRDLVRASSLDQYEHLAHFEVEQQQQPSSGRKRFLTSRESEEETDLTDSVENRADYRVKLNHSHSHSKQDQNRRR